METLPSADEFTADPGQIVQLRTIAKLHLDEAEKIAGPEGRSLKASEQRQFDAHVTEANKFRSLVEQVEFRQKQADENRAKFSGGLIRADAHDGIRSLLTGQVRTLDVNLGNVHREQRDLSKLTAAAGANTVPTSFVDQLYSHLIESSAIRQTNATVFSTDSGEDLQVPKTTAHSTAALTAEAASIAESDPTFGTTTLGAYKYGVLIQVTNELLTDTGVDLSGYLAEQTGRALGNASGAHMVVGTGSGQPQGVVNGSTLGVTGGTSVAGAFTADDLIDLMFSVIPQHRSRGYWTMNDTTLGAVRKLKDKDDNYLFVPNNSGGPDLLLGKPVVTDPNVADIGLGNVSVLFGDFSTYGIRDVSRVRFEASGDFAFQNDLMTFRAILRTDGRYISGAGGVKHFVGGAS